MWIIRVALRVAVAGVLSAATPGRVDGQVVGGISAVALEANERLLGDPLTGASARLSLPLGRGRISTRIGGERVSGAARRTGAPCGDRFARHAPGLCATEPLRDDARLWSATAGVDVRVWDQRRAAVRIATDVRVAALAVDTHGLSSGRSVQSSSFLGGLDVGVEASWGPWPQHPLALEAGIAVGRAAPLQFGSAMIATPRHYFVRDFTSARIQVGAAWRRRAR